MKQSDSKNVIFRRSGKMLPSTDSLALEAPLIINGNNGPVATTMRTPGMDSFLVYGYLFGEGLICEDKLPELIIEDHVVNVKGDLESRRLGLTSSSCGFCGSDNIDELLNIDHKVEPISLNADSIPGLFEDMALRQHTFKDTGAVHAAAVFNKNGEFLFAAEDIGRHNAVDKIIGYCLKEGILAEASIMTVSGRISFEILQKCYRAGISSLLGVSAPTSLAVEKAKEAGICLIGFCRGEDFTVYSSFDSLR